MSEKLDPDELARVLEKFVESIRGTGEATADVNVSLEKQAAQSAGYVRANDGSLKKIVTQAQKRAEIEEKLNKELEAQFGKDKIIANKREAMFKEQLAQMNYAIDSNNKLVKTTVELTDSQRKQIKNLKDTEERASKWTQAQDNFKETLLTGLKDISKSFGTFAMGLAKGETSFTSLNPIIEAVGNTLANLVKSIPYVGSFLEAGVKATVEASKFMLEMLSKNMKVFQELSNSGALVANGMKGVSEQFVQSGMSLDGFKKVVKENGSTLAAYGGTVGLGAEKFTKAVGALTKPGDGPLARAGLGLRALGMTSDDIGEAAASFLQQEIRLGRGRQMNETQLAEGTIRYAKELDALQKVTGLSREEFRKQRDELMSDSRYRASRASMNETGAKALDSFIMTLKDPEMKRGFMDLASGVISTEAAGKLITAMGDTAPQIIESLKNVKPGEVARVYDQSNLMLQKGAQQMVDQFGEVGKMIDPSVLGNMATYLDLAGGKGLSSMKDAMKTQQKQLNETDKLTKETVTAQMKMEELGRKMFELANKTLPYAASAVDTFATALLDAIDYIEKRFGIKPKPESIPTPAKATEQREHAERNAAEARRKMEEAEAQGGRGSDAAIQARIEEAKARRAAERARAIEESSRRTQSQRQGPTGRRDEPSATPEAKPVTGSSTDPNNPTLKVTQEDLSKIHNLKFNSNRNVHEKDSQLDPKLISLAQEIQSNLPGFLEFTSFNDKLHQGDKYLGSLHNKGKAVDFVLDHTPSREEGQEIVDMLQSMGASKAIDEYNNRGPMSTGNHIHAQIGQARFGATFSGPESGYPVLLHGKNEHVLTNPQLENLISSVKQESIQKVVSGKMYPNASMAANDDTTTNMIKDLYNIMTDKLDGVITKLDEGNDIQNRILRNSMV